MEQHARPRQATECVHTVAAAAGSAEGQMPAYDWVAHCDLPPLMRAWLRVAALANVSVPSCGMGVQPGRDSLKGLVT